LVITLLLLFLMSVLGLAAVLSTSSDLLINGYYGNSRASFYAADAGLNIARQAAEAELQTLATAASAGTNGVWNTQWNNAPCGSWSTTTNPTVSAEIAANPTYYPIASTSAATALNSITAYETTTYLAGSKATNAGAAAGSWGESFSIQSNPAPTLTLTGLTISCVPNLNFPGTFQYVYSYTITSIGTAAGMGSATVTENGSLTVNITAPPGVIPENYSFSGFGAYIGNFPPCSGGLVSGTISGPVFADATTGCPNGVTNCGEWDWTGGSSYIYTNPVNQTGPKFSSGSGSGCPQSATIPFKGSNGSQVNPTFQAGANLNQASIPVPANSFSQRWAVLDGLGCGTNEGGGTCIQVPPVLPPAPTAMQMYQYNLQNVAQNNAAAKSYATTSGSGASETFTAATSGVFIPYTCSGSTCSLTNNTPTIAVNSSIAGNANNLSGTAGGIWVEGSASGLTTTITFSTTNGSGGTTNPSGQIITIVQTPKTGSATTYTITIDPVANTTKVVTTGATSATLNLVGVPQNILGSVLPANMSSSAPPTFPGTNSIPAATVIYVDGSVSVTGPSSGAAIQDNHMVSVVANGNITQTGNLTYAEEPVTTSAGQTVTGSSPACCSSSSPVDTLIPGYTNNSTMNQVLGLYTANGQFILNPSSNGGNLETDGAIAVITPNLTGCNSSGADCGIGDIATGNSVGTWKVIGGRSESSINSVSISTGNTYYDQRFATRTNFAPPFFPQTSIAVQDVTGATTTATVINITQQRVQWINTTGGQ
jgi:Tfp pilus assembly protein PilX